MTVMLKQPHLVPNFQDGLNRLRDLADTRPNALALRHKHRGQWYVWRWRDVADEVQRLASGLKLIGFTAGDNLAVSGDFGPHLLLIALAARNNGGTVLAVAPDADAGEIADLLGGRDVRYAFTQGRQNLALWLQVAKQNDIDLRVIFDHATSDGKISDSHAITFEALRASGNASASGARISRRNAGAAADLVWVEENTRWQDGLDIVLHQWLQGALTLAFPESLAASERDRREVAPRRMLLSATRLVALHDEIIGRFPPRGSWQRRLADWAVRSGGAFRGWWTSRLIVHLIRRPLGLRRLREIAVITVAEGPVSTALPASVRQLFAGLAVFLAPQPGLSSPIQVEIQPAYRVPSTRPNSAPALVNS
ncbi:MAG: AMP-binding protein [Dongiaceae bacterium]